MDYAKQVNKKVVQEEKELIREQANDAVFDRGTLGGIPLLASLVGTRLKVPKLKGLTTWDVVQMYVVYTYVFSLINGVKEYTLKGITDMDETNTSGEIGNKNPFLRDKILKIANGLRPITAFEKFREGNITNVFDHDQRFVQSDLDWFVFCPVLQRLIWIPEHPYVLLNDLIKVKGNETYERIFDEITKISRDSLSDLKDNEVQLSKNREKRTNVEVPFVMAVIANAPNWEKYSIFRQDKQVKEVRNLAALDPPVKRDDILTLISGLYNYTVETDDESSHPSLQFRMFLDYMVKREEMLFLIGENDISEYGMKEVTFFRSFYKQKFDSF